MRINDIYRMMAVAAALTALLGTAAIAYETKSHVDDLANPEGCMACHRGRGVRGTALLADRREELCFRCHGSDSGRRVNRSRFNIEAVLQKDSVHPFRDTSQYHMMAERLPETNPSVPRHVACQDCHRVHISSDVSPTKGARGYAPGDMRRKLGEEKPRGIRFRRASTDYDICYQCHADSANLPSERIVAAEFNPLNASYHPVEMTGKNKDVPSLIGGMSENSKIGCGSCHGNNDPAGPRGPHGSDYKPLLISEYVQEDGPELMESYALCYICHRRSSIMKNESFKAHEEHIVSQDTSCHTCHNSHGSEIYTDLIEFNEDVVSPSNTSMMLEYVPGPGGRPRCYLTCHDADHAMDSIANKPWPW
jgi:predicted CXXCH cytochrome family protein